MAASSQLSQTTVIGYDRPLRAAAPAAQRISKKRGQVVASRITVCRQKKSAPTTVERLSVCGGDLSTGNDAALEFPDTALEVIDRETAHMAFNAFEILAHGLNLHRREADVAIRATDEPEPSLFGVRLTEQRAAVYASPAYLADRAAGLAGPSADADLDWIGHVDQVEPPPEIVALYPRMRISVRLDDKLGALAAARAGLGLCRLPCFQGDTDPGLARVPGLPLARYPDKWVLTHADLKSVERVRLFMRAASQAIKRLRPLFMGERPARS